MLDRLEPPPRFVARLAAWRPTGEGGDWLIRGAWRGVYGYFLNYHWATGGWVYPAQSGAAFGAPFILPGVAGRAAVSPESDAAAFATSSTHAALFALTAGSLREYRYPECQPRHPSAAVAALRLREPALLAASGDGSWLVAAGADGSVSTLDCRTLCPGGRVGLGRAGRPLTVSVSNAGVVALSTPDELRFHDAATGHLSAAHVTAAPQTLLTWSDDGALLLSAQADGTVSLWRGESLQARHRWPARGVRALCVNPDRTQAAVGGRRRVVVFDLDD